MAKKAKKKVTNADVLKAAVDVYYSAERFAKEFEKESSDNDSLKLKYIELLNYFETLSDVTLKLRSSFEHQYWND